ncbi:WecB/TagA/CpsF family glycosyltransferase [Acetilactobacillus jinshanensis]|uniref:WecB/TagA/CpsF family glycosyltransferase n=1 Tax=Acetilactobacillus jinshanensis TaxID=1720083 RepID=UPI001EEEBE70|nr:WecB/TagA/CpsF family glycosyltransferase [Acetilactobacillus jinshanensis]
MIEQRIQHHQNTFIVTANPEIVIYANQHSSYNQLIKRADYITPDGIGIVKAAKILNDPMPGRISGFDLFVQFLKWGNEHHKSIYLLGSHQAVIDDLIKVIHHRWPNLAILGSHNGYFSDSRAITKQIQVKQPDMVFVALGYPKQEAFINRYRKLSNSLWIGIGGSFDVLSGHTKRAPQFWINHHVEWLYRLLKQPQRIGRMMSLPRFLIDVYKQKMTKPK